MIIRYENKEGLVLFKVNYHNTDINKIEKGLTNILSSIKYNENYTYNLIFINHPFENYIGFSLINNNYSEDEVLKEKKLLFIDKVNSYKNGLKYLLNKNLEGLDFIELSDTEIINVLNNLYNSSYIPKNLSSSQKEDSKESLLEIVYCRPILSGIVLDKIIEFYEKNKSLEEGDYKMGMKPILDERIFEFLKDPYLTYKFNFYNNDNKLGNTEQPITDNNSDSVILLLEFLDLMGVPNKYISHIYSANNSSDLLDNPLIQLSNSERSAKTILNIK